MAILLIGQVSLPVKEQKHVAYGPLIHMRQALILVIIDEEVERLANFLHGRLTLAVGPHVLLQHVDELEGLCQALIASGAIHYYW